MAKDKEKKKVPFNVFRKGIAGALIGATILASGVTLAACGKQGADGKDGKDGLDGTIWKSGASYTEFADAKVGDYFIDTDDYILYQRGESDWVIVMENYGRPAQAPTISIGEDGCWAVDGVSTGVKARGEDGQPGSSPVVTINEEGFWCVNGVSTGVKARGEDGENGENGENGAPGHSPVVTINEEGYWVIDGVATQTKATPSTISIVGGYWYLDGTTTNIKAEGKDGNTWLSGTKDPSTEGNVGDFYLNTSTYDIWQKNAEGWIEIGNIKGKDGAAGSGSTTGTSIPSYWKTYLDQKIKEINSKGELLGSAADSFIFITDQHLQGSLDYSADLINYICENTSIKKVVMGGDIVQGSASDNALLRQYRNSFNDDLLVMAIRGNHDVWGNATENSFWDIMNRPLEGKVDMFDELYYSYDNEAQKIRYIFTDSTYASSDGNNNLTSNEQIAWMQEKILELDSDWTVMVFHHGVWTASKDATIPINNDGQLMIDAIDEIYDEAACTIAGIYTGHSHRDYYQQADKGYALIATTLDCSSSGQSTYDIVNPSRPSGSTKEQTFDIVFFNPTTNTIETIRIGAGDNRTMTYSSNVVVGVQGVSLNKTTATTWADGNTVSLEAIFNPTSATNKKVTWEITKGQELGTISTDGRTCVFTPGTTTGEVEITVTTVEGGFTATCTITIEAEASSEDITSQFAPWTPGTITWKTGVTGTNDTNWLYSNYVDVSKYKSITFSHIQTTTKDTSLGYAFYDENKTYISGASNSGESYAPVNRTVDIPENAVYFRTMWMNETNSNKIDGVTDLARFYCFGNPFSASEGGADVVDPPELDTTVKSVSLNKTTAKTRVGGSVVDLTATINPSYAENKEVSWVIESGSEFASISSDGLNCTITPKAVGTVVVKVTTEEGDFTATCTITIEEQVAKGDITDEVTWEAGGVNWKTGANVSDNNWLRSNYIDIGEYTVLTFMSAQTPTQDTSLGYAFYNASKGYISGASNTGAGYAPAEKIVDVPANAKYIRIMWMNHETNANKIVGETELEHFYIIASNEARVYPVEGVSLDKETATTWVGGNNVVLTAVLNPTNATNQEVVWSIKSGAEFGQITPNGLTCTFAPTAAGVVVVEVKTAEGDFVATCTITIEEEIPVDDITSQFTWTPGTIVASSGATGSSDTAWLYSNQVDISAYSSVTFAHIQTTNDKTTLGYTFYDASDKVVGSMTNAGSSYAPFDRTVDVPENAKYIRVMWINTTNTNYDESIHGIENFYFYGNP